MSLSTPNTGDNFRQRQTTAAPHIHPTQSNIVGTAGWGLVLGAAIGGYLGYGSSLLLPLCSLHPSPFLTVSLVVPFPLQRPARTRSSGRGWPPTERSTAIRCRHGTSARARRGPSVTRTGARRTAAPSRPRRLERKRTYVQRDHTIYSFCNNHYQSFANPGSNRLCLIF
jgi:hypothetical protein